MGSPYEQDLGKNAANHQPLTPLTYLERAASTYPDHVAIIHGSQRITYRTFWQRSLKLASALSKRGIGKGDTVTVMLSNTPPMLEAHFGVPMAKAVLHSLNTRLDAAVIAFQLDHAETKVLIVDREFAAVVKQALALAKVKPLVIDYDDPDYASDAPYPKGERIGAIDYEGFVAGGDEGYAWSMPDDEWDAISLNYTSGTTGNPKGVVYHHRGAKPIYDAIADHGVTHLCGAPVVMSVLINASDEDKRHFPQTVTFNTAAAPPPEAVLSGMADAGFAVTHLYGLTETYGPAVVNEWHTAWDGLDKGERSARKARQGVRYAALEGLTVMDAETMQKTPADGETIGEVMFRGNIVMKGYLKNRKATDEAFAGGWFHSGDLGVMHPDGYIQLKDRSKDIIISGGENISSIEVEEALYKHPSVASCGVVAKADDKWGEVPVAYVELKPGKVASEAEIIEHCRALLARFKVPKAVIFAEIPKTSTGKIQKFQLREMAKGS
ncbi:AMP-binding protein [Mesorhizobium sp. L2C067A000]|uniref:AMP-binding protein n=1 Tax=Mesorhizobium sp. L2C067A000 TaxID=1287106 RepID=UPI0003CFD4E5|nr:AMP-binding protein [Mesorhizobium sp. L2C067A000]ESZ34849.1 acyl-CoA synthetase [Mesorhizobium sp. L2C067A000]